MDQPATFKVYQKKLLLGLVLSIHLLSLRPSSKLMLMLRTDKKILIISFGLKTLLVMVLIGIGVWPVQECYGILLPSSMMMEKLQLSILLKMGNALMKSMWTKLLLIITMTELSLIWSFKERLITLNHTSPGK